MSKTRTKEPINEDYLFLGQRLAFYRNLIGLSQAEVSQKLNMPQSTYAGYETGTRKINLRTLNLFATFYDVPVSSLISREPEAEAVTGDKTDYILATPQEKFLIELYRRADEETRRMIERLLKYNDIIRERKGGL